VPTGLADILTTGRNTVSSTSWTRPGHNPAISSCPCRPRSHPAMRSRLLPALSCCSAGPRPPSAEPPRALDSEDGPPNTGNRITPTRIHFPMTSLQGSRANSSSTQVLPMASRLSYLIVCCLRLEVFRLLFRLKSPTGTTAKLTPLEILARLRRAIPVSWVPSGSSARVLRSAVLNCHQEICEVMVTPLSATR